MPDIELRFNRDMLVLSAPIDAALARQGIDADRDRQYLNLMEPDVVRDALRLEAMAGAHCIVATTEDLTQARLAHLRMEGDAVTLAHAAIQIASELKPQHLIAELGPCGLPLDPSSKASLNENRAQYAQAMRAIDPEPIDALLLNGFTSVDDLKCALMGVRQVSAIPVFASVTIGEVGSAADLRAAQKRSDTLVSPVDQVLQSLGPEAESKGFKVVEDTPFSGSVGYRAPLSPEAWPEAVAVMQDLGASVIGFETVEPAFKAVEYATQAASLTSLPLLAQLRVTADSSDSARAKAPLVPLEDILDYTPDTMTTAAVKLYGAGVQFLRATGTATSSYTGALAATVYGLDVRER